MHETSRCGKCENCLSLERGRASVLKVANPPFSHADQTHRQRIDGVAEFARIWRVG